MVSEIRHIVNVKDSFSRINQEREKEREDKAFKEKKRREQEINKKNERSQIKQEFYELFKLDDKPHDRGKLLEKVLNRLFSSYDILIKEDFKRKVDDIGVVEQIDGVISFDGHIYLVEMKWLSSSIGVADVSQHLVRLYGRPEARGIFISYSPYADTVITECQRVLSQKLIVLCILEEIVYLLEKESDLKEFLRRKVNSVILDQKPFTKILS